MLKKWLSRLVADAPKVENGLPIELATAVLLLECARADFQREDAEIAAIRTALATKFGVEDQTLQKLMSDAEHSAEQAVSLHGPISRLNESLGAADKRSLMACLWQVAWADKQLDPQEEHLLRQIADLLHIPHAEFIQTKLEVCQTG